MEILPIIQESRGKRAPGCNGTNRQYSQVLTIASLTVCRRTSRRHGQHLHRTESSSSRTDTRPNCYKHCSPTQTGINTDRS